MKKAEQTGPHFGFSYQNGAHKKTIDFSFSFEAVIIVVFGLVLAIIGLAHACNQPDVVQAPGEYETRMDVSIAPPALPAAFSEAPKIIATPAKKPIATAKKMKRVKFEGDNGKRDSAYIRRFQVVAIHEMQKFGIPASIKMAQGLLESQGGQSELSRHHNNHFGMKCHASRCPPGHCVNYKDDSHKDFFKTFGNAWESWRAHSLLLQGDRYRHLKGKNYKDFAHGLKKAGYATDKRYAYKIIAIIQRYDLTRLDQGQTFFK